MHYRLVLFVVEEWKSFSLLPFLATSGRTVERYNGIYRWCTKNIAQCFARSWAIFHGLLWRPAHGWIAEDAVLSALLAISSRDRLSMCHWCSAFGACLAGLLQPHFVPTLIMRSVAWKFLHIRSLPSPPMEDQIFGKQRQPVNLGTLFCVWHTFFIWLWRRVYASGRSRTVKSKIVVSICLVTGKKPVHLLDVEKSRWRSRSPSIASGILAFVIETFVGVHWH